MNDELKIEILELNEVVNINIATEEETIIILVEENNSTTELSIIENNDSIEVEVSEIEEVVNLTIEEVGIKGDDGLGANEANDIRDRLLILENSKHEWNKTQW